MHLVDDEHLVPVPDRHERETVDDDFPDVFNAGVGGSVDLEDVDVAALCNLAARVALPARVPRRSRLTVERARQNPCGGGLAHAARPCKHERLRNAPARNRVLQRTRHRRLADDIVELLRSPFSGENLVGHRGKQEPCNLKLESGN